MIWLKFSDGSIQTFEPDQLIRVPNPSKWGMKAHMCFRNCEHLVNEDGRTFMAAQHICVGEPAFSSVEADDFDDSLTVAEKLP